MRFVRSGFTLIEVIVVMLVLSALSTGIFISIDKNLAKGRDARRKEDLKAIRSAIVSYYYDNGNYPPAIANPSTAFASDEDSPWIPDITPYLNIAPKDPKQANLISQIAGSFWNKSKNSLRGLGNVMPKKQQKPPKPQVAGAQTITIATGPDDAKRGDSVFGEPAFANDHTDDPVGKPFRCDDNYRRSVLRYTAVTIPKGSTINTAQVTFWPRNELGSPSDSQINTLDTVKSNFRAQKTGNAPQVTSMAGWTNLDLTSGSYTDATVAWNSIPHWVAGNTYASPDITSVVQEVVSQDTWASGNAMNIFWEDNGSTGPGPDGDTNPPYCAGRISLSFEGAAATVDPNDSAPTLTVTYTPPSPGNYISCEAENGSLAGPMTAPANDLDASGSANNYIRSTVDDKSGPGPTGLPTGTGGSSTFQVYVANPGTYYFWSRNKYPGGSLSSNSYWLQITASGTYHEAGNNNPGNGNWNWTNIGDGDGNSPGPAYTISYNFTTAGVYQIKLFGREQDTRIDKFELVTNSSYVPSGTGDPTSCSSTAPPPPPTCSPANQSVNAGVTATLAASGGDGTYTWSAPGGTPTSGNGTPFSVSYATTGTYSVSVTSASQTSPTCTVTVASGTSACDEKKFVYCYIVTTDRSAFVLWGQIENSNDSELYTSSTAACKLTDLAPAISAPPPGSYNICLKPPS